MSSDKCIHDNNSNVFNKERRLTSLCIIKVDALYNCHKAIKLGIDEMDD